MPWNYICVYGLALPCLAFQFSVSPATRRVEGHILYTHTDTLVWCVGIFCNVMEVIAIKVSLICLKKALRNQEVWK